jgi:DNA-binding transcriptional ArsR family regulator
MHHDHDPSSGHPKMLDPERVARAQSSMLDSTEATHLAARFKLLSDPGRIGILSALAEVGEMNVCDIAASVGASESGTSHQLKHLRVGGLVRSRKQGRSVYYSLADDHVQQLLDVTAEHYLRDHGEQP